MGCLCQILVQCVSQLPAKYIAENLQGEAGPTGFWR